MLELLKSQCAWGVLQVGGGGVKGALPLGTLGLLVVEEGREFFALVGGDLLVVLGSLHDRREGEELGLQAALLADLAGFLLREVALERSPGADSLALEAGGGPLRVVDSLAQLSQELQDLLDGRGVGLDADGHQRLDDRAVGGELLEVLHLPEVLGNGGELSLDLDEGSLSELGDESDRLIEGGHGLLVLLGVSNELGSLLGPGVPARNKGLREPGDLRDGLREGLLGGHGHLGGGDLGLLRELDVGRGLDDLIGVGLEGGLARGGLLAPELLSLGVLGLERFHDVVDELEDLLDDPVRGEVELHLGEDHVPEWVGVNLARLVKSSLSLPRRARRSCGTPSAGVLNRKRSRKTGR